MKTILSPGTDSYRATCSECGTVFRYERSDVGHNFVRGREETSCPHCGRGVPHRGAVRGWTEPRWGHA